MRYVFESIVLDGPAMEAQPEIIHYSASGTRTHIPAKVCPHGWLMPADAETCECGDVEASERGEVEPCAT